jgi:hypothetical protein
MEQQGKPNRKKNGTRLRDTIEIHYEKDGVIKPVELRGRLISALANPDGTTHWAFWARQKPTNAKTPSTLGGGEKESARDILSRKMSGQRGSFRLLSPRGTAAEKAGLIAWGALLGAAIYKNLSHLFGF